ncbi:hypothetical protein CkaCkLH20_03450 [Colletotrichum karsti]|uniref:Uncharacterized protein n=1 Tax=Colletotrichum karsti TaxID=1095194 RepID=A0A9P6IBC8_9PEZI|nr:uncharacterized protein CkaCkLH20_03450 [Colletotrichum karsti]KAF9879217.1 hypothetical protein CkaCkLH20_03450 [Colletotrichum karsti]
MTSSPKSKLDALKRIITSSSSSHPDQSPPPTDNSPTSPATTTRTTKSWPEHDEVGESSRMAEERGSDPGNSSPGPSLSPRRSRFHEDNGAVGAAAARRGSAFTDGENTLVGGETTNEGVKRGADESGDERERVESWRVNIVHTAEGEKQWEEERRRELEARREEEEEKEPGFVEDVVAVLRKMVHKRDRKGKGKGVAACECCPQRKRSFRKFMETPEAWWKATRP